MRQSIPPSDPLLRARVTLELAHAAADFTDSEAQAVDALLAAPGGHAALRRVILFYAALPSEHREQLHAIIHPPLRFRRHPS